jgi:CRISPR-associated endonuclease/helicase Cas3
MASDLKFAATFLSHPPKKFLETHIEGVMRKASRRSQTKLTEVAALFHDLGKLNPNFQEKLKPNVKVTAYSNHSLLSAVGLICFAIKNESILRGWFKEDTLLKLKMALAIIVTHHGNLPNLREVAAKNSNYDPKGELFKFLTTQTELSLPMSGFLNVILKENFKDFSIFDAVRFEKYWLMFHFGDEKSLESWCKNALDNFLETQSSFSSLIEADKRDAGGNENYQLNDRLNANIENLAESLEATFQDFKDGIKKLEQIELNIEDTRKLSLNLLRTEIREEAVAKIKTELPNGKRIFSLTAPTGAGKTYALLALAKEIQAIDKKASVLYALPFLSIIEQVEDIAKQLLPEIPKTENTEGYAQVLAYHSKSVNTEIEQIQEELEKDQNAENLKKLVHLDFSAATFDHPFILTTFVQFFETLMSNYNSTLLKLPNFKNRIFLIDEIQALPPRLYIFFTAWLDAFCRKFDSYCILSTATMPYFEIEASKTYAKQLFKDYEIPIELLNAQKFFEQKPFNRYQVSWFGGDSVTLNDLKIEIGNQTESCLIILNTIDDTRKLYDLLNESENCILLNTHFITADRKDKIKKAQDFLKRKEKVILISTQLIEAGVDIDFPIVYRDLCPLPSLIQSAGRCNRNGLLDFGRVHFFRLKKDNGQFSCNQIYREDEARDFLKFSRKEIIGTVEEKELFDIQKRFFKYIGENLTIGSYEEGGINSMIDCINEAKFKDLGKFRLILEKFGDQVTYYIPKDSNDKKFEELIELIEMVKTKFGQDYKVVKASQIKVENHMKKMADRLLNVRINPHAKNSENAQQKLIPTSGEPVMGLFCLSDLNDYSSETGIAKFSDSIL